MVNEKKISKRLLALLMAMIMVICAFPAGLASVFAAAVSNFKVEITDYDYSVGTVTLTDTTDSTLVYTADIENGKAVIKDNDIDDEHSFDIEIKDLIGYEDYSNSGITIEGTSLTIDPSTTLVAIDQHSVTGKTIDEKTSDPIENAEISYSAYNGEVTGTVNTNDNGEFTFDVFDGVEYSVDINAGDKYVAENKSLTANADYDFGDIALKVTQFAVSFNCGENGKIDGNTGLSSIFVDYGENAPVIPVVADQNYRIESLSVDGTEINAAVGQESYDVDSITNVKESHAISATFYRPEYEITINFNSHGQVKDNSDNPVADGGKVILKQGDSAGFKAIADTTDGYHISSVVVDSNERGPWGNAKDIYEESFNDNKAHSVTITFAINVYNVSINTPTNGTANLSSTTVDYDNSSTVTLAPADGYDVSVFTVNGTDKITEIQNDYTYVIENITEDTVVDVQYSEISTSIPSDLLSNEYYNITFSKEPVDEYVKDDGTTVIVLDKDATATVSSTSTYNWGIQVNSVNIAGYRSSKTFTSTTTINSIASSKGIGDKKVCLPNILIIIDKDKPELKEITPLAWNNQKLTVNGEVSDGSTTNPQSAIDKIVYGTVNNYAEATEVATLNAEKTAYSFEITNEENKTYYVFAVDKSGNVSESKQFVSNIDKTVPVINSFEFNDGVNVTKNGVYFNNSVNITIEASDPEKSVTNVSDVMTCSGVKSITLYIGDTEIATTDVDEYGKATFTVNSADRSVIKVVATDNAGNNSVDTYLNKHFNAPTTEIDNANTLTIQTVVPTVKITQQDATDSLVRYDEKDENGNISKVWFNGNASFIVDVSDEYGIKNVTIKLNGEFVEVTSDGTTLIEDTVIKDFSNGDDANKDAKYIINTADYDFAEADGENELAVVVENATLNSNDVVKEKLYLDITNPTIDEFNFAAKNVNMLSKALNFLTFGIFFNEDISVTVISRDRNASSDVKSITLYSDSNAVETKNVEKVVTESDTYYKATFDLLKNNFDAEQTISAIATDNVENKTEEKVMPNTENSNIFEANQKLEKGVNCPKLMIETEAPSIAVKIDTPAQDKNSATKDANDWYSKDISFDLSLADAKSGIRSVSVKINGKDILTDKNGKNINETFFANAAKTNAVSFTVNTDQAERAKDGSYKIDVQLVDNAGNASTYTKTVYKDINAPSITNFQFEATGYKNDTAVNETNGKPVIETSYGFYFIKDTKVTVSSNDVDPTAGIKSITYYTVDKNGTVTDQTTVLVDKDNKISFTIPANFKGQIYAKATDNVDNTPDTFVNPNSAVIEDMDQHNKTSFINYTLDEKNAVKDSKGNNLYAANTNVKVEISDTYSGIRQLDWEIVSKYDDHKEAGTVTIDNDGIVTSAAKDGYSDACLGDWVAEYDDNLVTNLKNTIHVTNDCNNIEIRFTLTDRAGNKTENVVQKLSIDKTAPRIVVQMNENDDKKFDGYFSGDRTVDVYVYERNFKSSDFTFNVTRNANAKGSEDYLDYSITPKFKKVGVQVINGIECYVYKMSTKFTKDGDYKFAVSAKDMASYCENSVDKKHVTTDKAVKYSSNKKDTFVSQNDADRAIDKVFHIDTKAPVIKVSYDNNNVLNGKYFDDVRTATIEITDHSFTDAKGRITYDNMTATLDGKNITIPKASEWKHVEGDTYRATINYKADGDYKFDMQAVDMAGNKNKDIEYSGKAPKEFTVDTTIDKKPTITGVVNGVAYPDSVLPQILFDDVNIDNYEVTLIRQNKGVTSGNIASEFIHIDKNGHVCSYKANESTFEKVQSVDGIYTLTVAMNDKAGHSATETVKFTVNRFGSVYSFNDYLMNDVNGKYVNSIDQNIVITEYNPTRLEKGSLNINIKCDGSLVQLKEGKDFTITPKMNTSAPIGSSGWYQYDYTIMPSVFKNSDGMIDGIYTINVASKDEVGNSSESDIGDEKNSLDIKFFIDTTAPKIVDVSGLEKDSVNGTKLDVSYKITDNIGLKRIDVTYIGEDGKVHNDIIASKDDKELSEEEITAFFESITEYEGSFVVGECINGVVRIVATDMANNITDTGTGKKDDQNIKNFDPKFDFNHVITVNTNPFIRWYANQLLFWSSIGVTVAAAAGVGFFLAFKRRKRDDARTEQIKQEARNKNK